MRTTKIKSAKGFWWKLFASMSVLAILMMANTTVMAQDKKTADNNIYDTPEVMPEYPGGVQAMMSFIGENVKYPEDAVKQKVEGRVMVQFVVETDGSISDVHVAKQVFPSLDAEAIRVVQAMPKWVPGREKGNVVRVKYNLPIVFRM